MAELPGIFSPETAMSLSDKATQRVAAETRESQAGRASSTKRLEILEETLGVIEYLR